MHLLNMINRALIYEFYKKSVFKSGYLLAGWKMTKHTKFQHNISKLITARQKKNRDMGCEYHKSYL